MPYSVPIGMKLCRHDPAPGSIGTAGGSTSKRHVRFRENENVQRDVMALQNFAVLS